MASHRVVTLLTSLYADAAELHRDLTLAGLAPETVIRLPATQISLQAYVEDAVVLLARRGEIAAPLFEALTSRFPGRRDDIAMVAKLYVGPASGPSPHSLPGKRAGLLVVVVVLATVTAFFLFGGPPSGLGSGEYRCWVDDQEQRACSIRAAKATNTVGLSMQAMDHDEAQGLTHLISADLSLSGGCVEGPVSIFLRIDGQELNVSEHGSMRFCKEYGGRWTGQWRVISGEYRSLLLQPR